LKDKILNYIEENKNWLVDKVYPFNNSNLKHFRIDLYEGIISNLADEIKPNIILFGATPIGR